MQTEAGLGFNISRGEGAVEVKGILVENMGSAIRNENQLALINHVCIIEEGSLCFTRHFDKYY